MGIFNNNLKRKSRRRNRSKGTSRFHSEYLRLVVYRSNKHFESQIVNDFEGQTIASCSSRDKNLKKQIDKSKNKTDLSVIVGKNLAKLAKEKKISKLYLIGMDILFMVVLKHSQMLHVKKD